MKKSLKLIEINQIMIKNRGLLSLVVVYAIFVASLIFVLLKPVISNNQYSNQSPVVNNHDISSSNHDFYIQPGKLHDTSLNKRLMVDQSINEVAISYVGDMNLVGFSDNDRNSKVMTMQHNKYLHYGSFSSVIHSTIKKFEGNFLKVFRRTIDDIKAVLQRVSNSLKFESKTQQKTSSSISIDPNFNELFIFPSDKPSNNLNLYNLDAKQLNMLLNTSNSIILKDTELLKRAKLTHFDITPFTLYQYFDAVDWSVTYHDLRFVIYNIYN